MQEDEHEWSNSQMVAKVALEEICHKYMHVLPHYYSFIC